MLSQERHGQVRRLFVCRRQDLHRLTFGLQTSHCPSVRRSPWPCTAQGRRTCTVSETRTVNPISPTDVHNTRPNVHRQPCPQRPWPFASTTVLTKTGRGKASSRPGAMRSPIFDGGLAGQPGWVGTVYTRASAGCCCRFSFGSRSGRSLTGGKAQGQCRCARLRVHALCARV